MLSDLNYEINLNEDMETKIQFIENVVETGTLNFIYDIFRTIDNNGSPSIGRYNYEDLIS